MEIRNPHPLVGQSKIQNLKSKIPKGHDVQNLAGLATLALVLALLPLTIQNNYILTILIFVAQFTILTIGLSLLMGYAGQISLGQATFFGIGAYTTAILATRFHVSPWLAFLAGVLLSAGIAYLVGGLIFRLHGHYLAMATLGMNTILFLTLTQEVEWTGGPSGLRGIPDLSLGPLMFAGDTYYFYLFWFFALLVIAASLNIVNSRVGRAMRALHASQVAAEALGIDTNAFKIKVFVLSAAYGGLAGGLHAAYLGFISPSSFGIGVSIELVVMAVVGGLASVWGPLFGASLVMMIEQYLRTAVKAIIPNASGEQEIIAFGLILMVIMIFLPEGLFTGLVKAGRRWYLRQWLLRPVQDR
ncbi:MAG: branched-chain amino acid ABC transporter permease [Anaerolineae bacterium]|nr:branched-chain amino acid ABC transporter permease [Anaerolineae bacterium]